MRAGGPGPYKCRQTFRENCRGRVSHPAVFPEHSGVSCGPGDPAPTNIPKPSGRIVGDEFPVPPFFQNVPAFHAGRGTRPLQMSPKPSGRIVGDGFPVPPFFPERSGVSCGPGDPAPTNVPKPSGRIVGDGFPVPPFFSRMFRRFMRAGGPGPYKILLGIVLH